MRHHREPRFYHYDDIVNPHPDGFKGIRIVIYSPVKYRQKYFSDKRYTTEQGILNEILRQKDIRKYIADNLNDAQVESQQYALAHKKHNNNLSSVPNITVASSVIGKKSNGVLSPPILRFQYQRRQKNYLLASHVVTVTKESDLVGAWDEIVDFKLDNEDPDFLEAWRAYYLELIPNWKDIENAFEKSVFKVRREWRQGALL